MAESKMT